jgi:hypothetical protein
MRDRAELLRLSCKSRRGCLVQAGGSGRSRDSRAIKSREKPQLEHGNVRVSTLFSCCQPCCEDDVDMQQPAEDDSM